MNTMGTMDSLSTMSSLSSLSAMKNESIPNVFINRNKNILILSTSSLSAMSSWSSVKEDLYSLCVQSHVIPMRNKQLGIK